MNYILTFCVLFSLLFTHVGYSSELRSKKSAMMILSSRGMNTSLYQDIVDRSSTIGSNHMLIYQYKSMAGAKKQPLDDKAIRLLMKNIELILDLEHLVNKNTDKMPMDSKKEVTDFTKQLKNNYLQNIFN